MSQKHATWHCTSHYAVCTTAVASRKRRVHVAVHRNLRANLISTAQASLSEQRGDFGGRRRLPGVSG